MKWYKAAVLGVIAYLLCAAVINSISVVFSIALNIIPIIGFFLGAFVSLSVSFVDGLFSGFIAGNLSTEHKKKAAVVSSFLGALIVTLLGLLLLLTVLGISGVITIISGDKNKFPILAAIIGGGFLGTLYLLTMSLLNISVSVVGGLIGGTLSLETSKRKSIR